MTTLGLIGLGRMGGNMARRLQQRGVDVIAFNRNHSVTESLAKECGLTAATSIEQLVEKLPTPRIVWLMLPAGDIVEQHIAQLKTLSRTRRHSCRRRKFLVQGHITSRRKIARNRHTLCGCRRIRRRMGISKRILHYGGRRKNRDRKIAARFCKRLHHPMTPAGCTPALSAAVTLPKWFTTASSTA
jgi:hypothetical protein